MFIRCNSKRDGFILYESIVALMITIMTLGILQQSLQILRTIQQTTFRDQLRWHVTQEKLQELLGKSEIKRIDEGRIIFFDKSAQKTRIIEKYNYDTLRISEATEDVSEPIITNLSKINIEKIQNLVIITTVNKAGQKSEMYLTNDP